MQCRAVPYEGNEPYIFFSYCHKDAKRVYPILEQMSLDGFRVWYDDGINAGDDWPQNIAEHLYKSSVCMVMLSEQSEKSHNCKNEVNFAIEHKKKLLVVKLEEFEMSLGMKLQLDNLRYLKKSDYPSDRVLLDELYKTEGLNECRGAESIPLRPPVVDKPPETSNEGNGAVKQFIKEEKKPPEIIKSVEEKPDDDPPEGNPPPVKVKKVKIKKPPVNEKKTEQEKPPEKPPETPPTGPDTDEVTIADPEGGGSGSGDETLIAGQNEDAVLIRLNTREVHFINSALTRLGRSMGSDFRISDNEYISSHHADIVFYNGSYYLRDAGSSNGTYIDEARLEKEKSVELTDMSIFRLHDEPFMLVFGKAAAAFRKTKCFAFLINKSTQCAKHVGQDGIYLDRRHAWPDGTLSGNKISRDHAVISFADGSFVLEDLGSKNGTYLDKERLTPKQPKVLRDRVELRLCDYTLEFGLITI